MHETLFGEAAVAILRIVNRYALDAEAKRAVNTQLRELTELLGTRSGPFTLSDAEAERVRALCSMTSRDIEAESAAHIARWNAMNSAARSVLADR